ELESEPIATAEFLVIDTETNGLGGEACELTEVGCVLVGGGELHDRWSSLARTSTPLRRGIQRLTGITQAMVEAAPSLEDVLPPLRERLHGRVMVAHNAPFDLRVLRQAFGRIGLDWPQPPVICTAALARALLPLQRKRGLGVLADALGIEVELAHRALADAETCARVLCALFPRLCANAATVADALTLLAPRRRASPRPSTGLPPGSLGAGLHRPRGRPARRRAGGEPAPDFAKLPKDPGVYIFRDPSGRVLYVGKSISIRSRARAHFAPSSPPAAWTEHAEIVDYRATGSELGALVLENRLIKELKPPGNKRLTRRDDRLVYIRCRLDIAYPILEVAIEPAAGHAVTIGPVRGRRLAAELVEQLDSLFGLRHCGRRLPRRDYPSAYGQMGRCLSPCLGDLDPNLYRRRLDEVLKLFVDGDGAGGGHRLIEHVYGQMRQAAAAQHFERASSLRRRAGRLATILGRLGGVLEATHARPRLILARHPSDSRLEGFWLAGGRLVDWGPVGEDVDELRARTATALARGGRTGELGAHVPPDEIDEVRIIGSWLASHPDAPRLALASEPDGDALAAFVKQARLAPAADPVAPPAVGLGPRGGSALERKLDDDGRDFVGADRH
ncbi:MAG: exonuclease domain-containing protein, partial [Solirubrobacteraceae bacterium]